MSEHNPENLTDPAVLEAKADEYGKDMFYEIYEKYGVGGAIAIVNALVMKSNLISLNAIQDGSDADNAKQVARDILDLHTDYLEDFINAE